MSIIVQRLFRSFFVFHNDKCEPLTLSGESVLWDSNTNNFAAVFEQIFNINLLKMIGKVVNKDSIF
jgi:hypothetical protein